MKQEIQSPREILIRKEQIPCGVKTVDRVIAGERIDPPMAAALQRIYGTPAEFWLLAQAAWDECEEKIEHPRVAEVVRWNA